MYMPKGFFMNTTIHIMQAITGDSVVLKFDKARCALQDSLKRVEDIVPQAIGCQVYLYSSFNDLLFSVRSCISIMRCV